MTSTALRKDSLQAVEQFDGEYRFLSNFWPCPIVWEGREAPTVEHHYNAAKTLNESERESVYACSTPGKAKRAGQRVTLRPGWDQEIKSQVMAKLSWLKFDDPTLKQQLLDTGDALLVEGNYWHDQYWGDCFCAKHRSQPGRNVLGQILMRIRALTRGDSPAIFSRVAVTGHRPQDLTDEQAAWAKKALQEVAIWLRDEFQIKTAISGMALGVDTWWAEASLDAGLDLWTYIPFPAQSAKWSESDVGTYEKLRARAAREVVLGEEYSNNLFHERNGLMVRDADLVVAVHHPSKTTGGTANCIRRARQAGRMMLRLNVATREITMVAAPLETAETREESGALF